jgi:pimeloyl-ACP methyl ester carboxylesterase
MLEGADGVAGFAHDLVMHLAPWGFQLAELRQPARLWYGTADENLPRSHVEHPATALPRATATHLDGVGHWPILTQAHRLLAGPMHPGDG